MTGTAVAIVIGVVAARGRAKVSFRTTVVRHRQPGGVREEGRATQRPHPPSVRSSEVQTVGDEVEARRASRSARQSRVLHTAPLGRGTVERRSERLHLRLQTQLAPAGGGTAKGLETDGALAVRLAEEIDRRGRVHTGLARSPGDSHPAVAVEHGGLPRVRLPVVPLVGADDEVAESVAVDVPRRTRCVTRQDTTLVALHEPRRLAGQPRSGTQVEVRPSFVELPVVVVRSADDDVAEAVAVDVSAPRAHVAERGSGLVTHRAPGRSAGQSRCGPEVEEGAAFVDVLSVVRRRPDEDVAEAIAVDVPRGGDGKAEQLVGLVTFADPCRRRGQSRGGAHEDIGASEDAIQPGAHDDVAVPVTVHVSGARDGRPECRSGLIGFCGPSCGGFRSARRAQVDERSPFVGLAVIVRERADDDVAIAVAVDVSGARDRAAELGADLIALDGPNGGWRQSRGGAQKHVRAPLVALPVVVQVGADDDIAVAIAVGVAG